MADNNDLKVIVGLNIPQSVVEIEDDLKIIEKTLANNDKGKLKITAGLNVGKTIGIINKQLDELKIDGSRLKITPTIDLSVGNQMAQQMSDQVNSAFSRIDFKHIAREIRELLNIKKNSGINEVAKDIQTMYESFNVDHDKYKAAFDNILNWYEKRSDNFILTEEDKIKHLNNLLQQWYKTPDLLTTLPKIGTYTKDNPLLVTEQTYAEIKKELDTLEEIKKYFGEVQIDNKKGMSIGDFMKDWKPYEYNDALRVYINYLKQIDELRSRNRLTLDEYMSKSENEDFKNQIEETILKQYKFIEVSNRVAQSNEQVAQSERDIAQAQKEIQNTSGDQLSFNDQKTAENLEKTKELNNELIQGEKELVNLKKERTEIQNRLSQNKDAFKMAFEFDDNYDKLESAIKKDEDSLKRIEQEITNKTSANKVIKDQIEELSNQLREESQKINQSTQNMGSAGGNGVGTSSEYLSSNISKITSVTNSAKEAEQSFKNLLASMGDTKGTVVSKEFADAAGKVNSFTVAVKSGTGAFETFKYSIDDKNGGFKLDNITAANAGILRLAEAQEKMSIKTEEVRNKYTRLLAEFKSSNSAIESGLTQPIQDFEAVLVGLGKTHSIEDVKNQFEQLKTSAAEISKYLDTTNNSFNKTRNAINNYNQMDDAIKRIETSYGNLVIKNEELGKSVTNLRNSYSALVEKEKEQGGYTAEWAKDYQAVNAALREVRVNVEAAVRAESNSQNADRNSQYQIQQRYLDRIRQNYIELNKLQNALVNSGKNETAEIQRQIKQVRSRISYATEQLKKRELFANVEAQINDYENEFDRKQSLRNSKETDKLIADYTKMADEISRATQELTKLQSSSTIKDNGNNTAVQNLKVQIDSVITDFNNLYERLSNSTVDKKTFVELQDQLSNIANKAKEVKNSFVDISNAISSDNKAQKQLERDQAQVASLERQINSLILQIKTLQATKRMTTGQSNSLTGLLSAVNASKDKSTLDDLKVKFAELRNEINLTDKQLKGEDKISDKYAKMASNIEVAIRKLYELKDDPVFNDRANATASAGIDAEINKITADYIALLDLLKNSPKDSNTLKSFETELKNISARASEVKAAINQIANNTTASEKLDSNFKSLATDIDNAISKLNSFDRSAIFRNHNMDSGVVQFKQELASLIEKYNQLKTALSSTPKTSEGFQQLQQQADALGIKLKQAKIRNDELQAGLKNADGVTQVTARVQKLTAQIKEYMALNTKASKKYSAQFEGLLSGLSQAEINKDGEAVRRLSADFQILRSNIKAAGDQGKTFGQTIVDNIKRFSSWMSLTSLIMRGVRSLKQMVTTVKEIDTAMVALKRVTDETATSYENFLKNTAKEAQRLHTTIDSLTTQITEWVKLGNSLDTATKLAEISMMYAKVGDIDDETAVKDLVATMKAFNIEAEKSISIVDALDTMNNKYASTAKDLGEGLRVASSSMSAAGNSFEKTLAMLTGGTEITQNANAMALGMRTVALRIRNMKGALQELNEEYEDLESISKIQTQILNLSGVNIFDPNGNFRDTYDILKDISEVYNDLQDKDKASLDTILFGTTRSNQGQALLKAFQSGQIQKALVDIQNSAGTAREEFTKYEQSIEAESYLAVWKQAV